MNTPASFFIGFSEDSPRPVEKSYLKRLVAEDMERRWFANMLWRAFPEANSEHELADMVAEVLTTERRPIHPKTVKNWLRCDNTPHFRYVFPVIAMAGAERLFDLFNPEE